MNLTQDQVKAEAFLWDFFASRETACCLKGYAGVGKTFLISNFIGQLTKKNTRMRVVVSAFTNKALDVLREKCGDLPIGFMTLDQLLGYRMSRNEDHELVRSENARQRDENDPDVVFVDECSMVKKSYFRDLLRRGFRVVFIGDPAQLPPINEEISESFNVQPQFQMTQIVRQAADNPIIRIATMLREKIQQKASFALPEIRMLTDAADRRVSYISEDALYKWAMNAYEKGMDGRILAFTNAAVIRHNAEMHSLCFPEARLFGAGERVIVNETYEISEEEMLYNGEMLTVVSCDQAETREGVVIFNVVGKRKNDSEVSVTVALDPAHADNTIKAMTEEIRELRLKVQSRTFEGQALADLKKQYQDLVERRRPLTKLAPLRHSYACTVHKSQGSTYDVAFLDWADFFKCRDAYDRARLVYVAVTRPSKFLVPVTR